MTTPVLDPWGQPYGSALQAQHAELLAARGVSATVAHECHLRSAVNKAALASIGYGPAAQRPPALVIPLHHPSGEPAGFQIRPDDPRADATGRTVKYETPSRQRMVLDVPPPVRGMVADPTVPLVVTEGPLKAAAAASFGLCCVALLGVWCWKGSNDNGASVALAAFEELALKGRRVIIAFDSDASFNPQVHEAMARFGAWLTHRGANVAYAYIPPGPHGAKQGLDDWLVAGHTGAELVEISGPGLRSLPSLNAAPTADADTFDDVAEESGASVLDATFQFLSRFLALPSDHYARLLALWAAHTHAIDCFDTTPRLAVVSPEKQSGKTRVLELLNLLAARPKLASSMSPASLFRMVAAQQPTILFDEIDAVFGPSAKGNEDLRSLLNSGYRRGAVVTRCEGDGANLKVSEYPSFAAVALAGIGDLPDTIADRALFIPMRRRKATEILEPYRRTRVEPEAGVIARRLAAWSRRHEEALRSSTPTMPAGIEDREAEAWEPLLAVADAAGGHWPVLARTAATFVHGQRAERTETLGVRLLSDCRTIIGNRDRITSEELVEALVALDEGPWADVNRGRGLDARGLSRRLCQFDIRSTTIRIGSKTPRGYHAADFADAWERYLGVEPHGQEPQHPQHATDTAGAAPSLSSNVADVADVADHAPDDDSVAHVPSQSRRIRVAL